jgi:hypothetical protein
MAVVIAREKEGLHYFHRCEKAVETGPFNLSITFGVPTSAGLL